MELGYLCRLRGIETITLTEAHAEDEGLRTNQRKGSKDSKDSLVRWTPRLRAAWDGALALRKRVIERTKRPEFLKPEQRVVIIGESGEPLQKSTLDSAWQRLIHAAIEEGVISKENRFGLHDLKRKGGTDSKGHRGDRQDALGVSDAIDERL